jgi:hypothetical protein
MQDAVRFLSVLSKNGVPSAGQSARERQNITKTDTCYTPLYAIPSGITNIKSFLRKVRCHCAYNKFRVDDQATFYIT